MARRILASLAVIAAALGLSLVVAAPASAIPSGSNTPFTRSATCTIETGPVTFTVEGYDYAGKTYIQTLRYSFAGEARSLGARYTDRIAGGATRVSPEVDTGEAHEDNVGRTIYDRNPFTGAPVPRRVDFTAYTTDTSSTACAVTVILPQLR